MNTAFPSASQGHGAQQASAMVPSLQTCVGIAWTQCPGHTEAFRKPPLLW
jgi:hypothetical protein